MKLSESDRLYVAAEVYGRMASKAYRRAVALQRMIVMGLPDVSEVRPRWLGRRWYRMMYRRKYKLAIRATSLVTISSALSGRSLARALECMRAMGAASLGYECSECGMLHGNEEADLECNRYMKGVF